MHSYYAVNTGPHNKAYTLGSMESQHILAPVHSGTSDLNQTALKIAVNNSAELEQSSYTPVQTEVAELEQPMH